MGADERLLAALDAAVAANPSDPSLRLHLADLLAEAGRPGPALEHYAEVLRIAPADQQALAGAARCAAATGDQARAEGYQRLLQALAGAASTPPPPNAPPAPGDWAPPSVPPAPPGPFADPPPVAPTGYGDRPVARPDDLPSTPAPVGAGPPAADEYDLFLQEVLEQAAGDVERPTVTLADVGGLDAVKKRLQVSFLGPMRNPKLRKLYGSTLRGGLLLYGPPGCGKTFLARALAGELGARFYAVGLHDVLDMWLGNSEKNLHAIFETARRHNPCVLFIDEIDALGRKRANLAQSAARSAVVQLLYELDSTQSDNDGLFMLGATNQPWDIDPALRRPGRFDRTVMVLPPDGPARAAILQAQLKDRPTDRIDLRPLIDRTEGFSGADLRFLCETAAEYAMADSIASGNARPITQRDMIAALAEIRPSSRLWFESVRNHALYANESGEYDELVTYLRKHKYV